MDAQALRELYDDLNPCACPYEKTILSGQGACARASRFCLAEREGVGCSAEPAQARCLALLEQLRAQARFSLKALDQQAALAHNKALRVQIGGLHGLHKALWPQQPVPATIGDIDALIEQALRRFGALDHLPLGPIVQQIAACPGRRPAHSK